MNRNIEKIRLIVADVDNTMIPAGRNSISDRLRRDLHIAMDHGIKVMVNTGRHYTFLQPSLFEDLPMDLIGTINGACLNRRDGTVVEMHPMTLQNMNDITDLCIAHDIGLGFKFVDRIVTYANHQKFMDGYVQKGAPWESTVLDDTKERKHHEQFGPPLGVFIIGTEEIIEPFTESIPEMQFAWSFRDGFDIFMKSVNKATSVEAALKTYGLQWENVIAFGDAGNDTPFIRPAAIGVALGNAKDDVAEQADIVAPTCLDDGMAAVLEELGIAKV